MDDLSVRDIAIILIVIVVLVLLGVMVLKKSRGGDLATFLGGAARRRTKRSEDPYMRSDEPWFTEIREGRKTVEVRVGPDGRYEDLIGKTVKFIGPEDQTVGVVVSKVRHYDTLDDLVKKEGWKKIAPQAKTDKAAKEAYSKITITRRSGLEVEVFSDERVAKLGGVNAVEFKLAPQTA